MNASPAPRTPPALRRSLDRMARRAHAFHRFAHHPLCVEYADERFKIGRVHLCRGCTLLLAGLLAGTLAAFALSARPEVLAVTLALAIALGLGSYAWRFGKFPGRMLPGVGIAYAAIQGLRSGPGGWVISLASGVAFATAVILYRRRGPHRVPCETCPERDRRPSCRGFAPILRRERALQRMAGKQIARVLQGK